MGTLVTAKVLVTVGIGLRCTNDLSRESYVRSSNKQELSSVDQFIVVMVQWCMLDAL